MGAAVFEGVYICLQEIFECSSEESNKSVYGELWHYPLYINSCMQSIKYWLKLRTMSDSRLPKQAYKMQLKLDENLNPCWVTRTKNFLCDFGFTDIWQQQGVGEEHIFLSVLKQRLLEKCNHEWLNAVNTSSRFSFCMTYFLFFFIYRDDPGRSISFYINGKKHSGISTFLLLSF